MAVSIVFKYNNKHRRHPVYLRISLLFKQLHPRADIYQYIRYKCLGKRYVMLLADTGFVGLGGNAFISAK
jgi:hypothetical protein